MGKVNTKNSEELEYKQIYLEIKGNELPTVVARPLKERSYPANHVPIPGCVVEIHRSVTEKDAFNIAGEIKRLCGGGQLLNGGVIQEHLAYTWSVLNDLIKDIEGDFTFSKATAETLVRGAMDHIRKAGKCIGFDYEGYREEGDES